jgi:hypothetical protein
MRCFVSALAAIALLGALGAQIPDLDTLAGTWQELEPVPRHGFGLPTANSELGSVIADENVLALRSATFAPYAQGPYSPILRNQSRLGRLTVDGAPVASGAYQWLPYGFRRRASVTVSDDASSATTAHVRPDGAHVSFAIESDARLDFSQKIMLSRATVTPSAAAKAHSLPTGHHAEPHAHTNRAAHVLGVELSPMFRRYGAAACTDEQWQFPADMQADPPCWNWYAPRPLLSEAPAFNVIFADLKSHMVVVSDARSDAIAVVGLARTASPPTGFGVLGGGADATWTVVSGQTAITIEFYVIVGRMEEQTTLLALAANVSASFATWFDGARTARQAQLQAALTPGSSRYSGHLPTLTAADPAISRMYYMGVLAVLALERVLPDAQPCAGVTRVWVTGGAENCTTNTFFWDHAFLPTLLVLLDPAAVRCTALVALRPDIGGDDARAGWGVDWRSLHRVGAWYAANDMALVKLVAHYVTVTGDFAFLNASVAGAPVLQRVESLVNHWRTLAQGARLADYGGAHNLLECVPSYIHRVASFNAANVWMMRLLAGLYADQGNATRAAALRADADALVAAVQTLYVPGRGFWVAQYPNGTAVEVRHVIDLVYVSEFMWVDLSAGQWRDMAAFARRELLHGDWMRAQSLSDLYANYSDRTDHGPWGAYDGWPALVAASFARQGDLASAEQLLVRFAAVAQRGPYGQAHGIRADPSQPAYKPFEFTLYNEIAGGAFAETLLLFVFGLQPTAASLATRTPPPLFMPQAPRTLAGTLSHVRWQGRLYTATAGANGVRWIEE